MDSSLEGTGPEDSDIEMVVKRTMTADWFLPSARQTPPQQAPPPRAPRRRKRPYSTDEPTKPQGDVPSRTPPIQSIALLVIREPAQDPRPSAVVGTNIASSSAASVARWQCAFRLGNWPLPTRSSVRNWDKRQGGRIAQSLGQALELPNDVQYFSEGDDEVVTIRLEWHTIAEMGVCCYHSPIFTIITIWYRGSQIHLGLEF